MESDKGILFHFYKTRKNDYYCLYYKPSTDTFSSVSYSDIEIYVHPTKNININVIKRKYKATRILELSDNFYFTLPPNSEIPYDLEQITNRKENYFIRFNELKFFSNEKDFVPIQLSILVYTLSKDTISFIVINSRKEASDVVSESMERINLESIIKSHKISIILHDNSKYLFNEMRDLIHFNINSVIDCFFPHLYGLQGTQYVSNILFGDYLDINEIKDKLLFYYTIFQICEDGIKKSCFVGNITMEQAIKDFPIYKPKIYNLERFSMEFGHYKDVFVYDLSILLGDDTFDNTNSIWLKAKCETQQVNIPDGFLGVYRRTCFTRNQVSSRLLNFYSNCFFLTNGTNIFVTRDSLVLLNLGDSEVDFEYAQFNNICSIVILNIINDISLDIGIIVNNIFVNNPMDFFIKDKGWRVNNTYTNNIREAIPTFYINDFRERNSFIKSHAIA